MDQKKETYNNNKDSKKEFINKEVKKESENKESNIVVKESEKDKETKIKEIKAQIEKLNNFIKKNSNNAVNCALCHDRIKQLKKMIKDIECGEVDYKVKTVKNAPSLSQHKDQKGFVRGQITNAGEVFEML